MVKTIEELLSYQLVETDNYTYDLTFEDRGHAIVVYSYDNQTHETEVYDVFTKTNNPALSYEDNFHANVKRYIEETF